MSGFFRGAIIRTNNLKGGAEMHTEGMLPMMARSEEKEKRTMRASLGCPGKFPPVAVARPRLCLGPPLAVPGTGGSAGTLAFTIG